MHNRQQHWLAVGLATSLALAAASSFGNSYRFNGQDGRAIARGEAFTATADNPSAIYYNPAGLSQLDGFQLRLGADNIFYGFEDTTPAGEIRSEDKFGFIPNFYGTYKMQELPLSFGLGLYAPAALATDWPDVAGYRQLGLSSEAKVLTLHPTIAWEIIPNLTLAVGPTFNWGSISLERGATPYPGVGTYNLDGDAFGVGYVLGVMWKPIEQIQIGATYRGEVSMEYNGSADVAGVPGLPSLNSSASAHLNLPSSAKLGVSYRPTDKWNLEFDIEWTRWDNFDVATISTPAFDSNPNPVIAYGVGHQSLVMNWENSFYYELGLTRKLNDTWSLSFGYIYNQNSIPDASQTLLIPDFDRQYVCAGVGFAKAHWSVDLAYQFGFANDRSIGSGPLAGTQLGGYSHALGVSVGYKF